MTHRTHVTILIGESGSGKSTWAKQNRPGAIVCSADDYFVTGGVYTFDATLLPNAHAACLRRFTEAVRDQISSIVVDNTNTTLVEIAPYIAVAAAYSADVEVVVMPSMNIDTLAGRNVHKVPHHTIKRQRDNIETTLAKWPSFWPMYR